MAMPFLFATLSILATKFSNIACSTYSKEKWYFVFKIVLTYCEKKCSSDGVKLLKFQAEGQRLIICYISRITRTIYSNS